MDQTEVVLGVVAIICTIGLPVALGLMACYMNIKSRHLERMALIEKGIDPNIRPPHREKTPNRYPTLRTGMFMVGIAAGLMVGLLIRPYVMEESEWWALMLPGGVLLFGGISFIIYFFISRSVYRKEQREERPAGW